MIAGMLLAAGRGTRFGSPKLLHEVGGKPLVYYSLKNCVDSDLDEIRVVIGTEAELLRTAIEKLFEGETRLSVVENEHPERGQMSSLKAGLKSLRSEHEAAMVVLADMPLVGPDIINGLIRVFREENAFVVPECGGTLYHPRIIPRRHFPKFLALRDDEKGSVVFDALPGEVRRVPIGRRRDYADIDSLEDLDALNSM